MRAHIKIVQNFKNTHDIDMLHRPANEALHPKWFIYNICNVSVKWEIRRENDAQIFDFWRVLKNIITEGIIKKDIQMPF